MTRAHTGTGALCGVDEGRVGAIRVGCLNRPVGRLPGGPWICADHLQRRRSCAAVAGAGGVLCARPGVAAVQGRWFCAAHDPARRR